MNLAPNLHLFAHDLEHNRQLPFETGFFNAITLLAVFEHLDKPVLLALLGEIKRVLARGGVFVMTTPADWTAGILKLLTRVSMVSGEEVGEHRDQYSKNEIADFLVKGGFSRDDVEVGSFELGLNHWARATRRA